MEVGCLADNFIYIIGQDVEKRARLVIYLEGTGIHLSVSQLWQNISITHGAFKRTEAWGP